jgi:hypothetical protein
MSESLIQRSRVSERRPSGRKALSSRKIMTLFGKKAPANPVPAAAVIREGRALFRMTGRKGQVGGL